MMATIMHVPFRNINNLMPLLSAVSLPGSAGS